MLLQQHELRRRPVPGVRLKGPLDGAGDGHGPATMGRSHSSAGGSAGGRRPLPPGRAASESSSVLPRAAGWAGAGRAAALGCSRRRPHRRPLRSSPGDPGDRDSDAPPAGACPAIRPPLPLPIKARRGGRRPPRSEPEGQALTWSPAGPGHWLPRCTGN